MSLGMEHIGSLPKGQNHFRESQRFTQLWIWAAVGVGALTVGILTWLPIPIWVLALSSVPVLVAALLLATGSLRTVVRSGGLYLRFFPFHLRGWKRVRLEEAVAVAAVDYHPVRQYGGWGIRIVPGGRAYNVKGTRGLRIDFEDGRHLLIGSQRPEELEAALREAGLVPTSPS